MVDGHRMWAIVVVTVVILALGFLLYAVGSGTFAGKAVENRQDFIFDNVVEVPSFEEAHAIPIFRSVSYDAEAVDIDNDGDLDLIQPQVTERSREVQDIGWKNRVYRNRGNGKFDDVSQQYFPEFENDQSIAVATGDLDGDNLPDVVFANYRDLPSIYLNRETHFEDISHDEQKVYYETRLQSENQAFSPLGRDVDIVDLDNDGDNDIVVLMNNNIRIYENEDNRFFRDMSHGWTHRRSAHRGSVGVPGVTLRNLQNGGARHFLITDLNEDGLPDIVVPTIHKDLDEDDLALRRQPNPIYMNVPSRDDPSRRQFKTDPCFTIPELTHSYVVTEVDLVGDEKKELYFSNFKEEPLIYAVEYSQEDHAACLRAHRDDENSDASLLHKIDLRDTNLPQGDVTHRQAPRFTDIDVDGDDDIVFYRPVGGPGCQNSFVENQFGTECNMQIFRNEGGEYQLLPVDTVEDRPAGGSAYWDVVIEDFTGDGHKDIFYDSGASHLVENTGEDVPRFVRSLHDSLPFSDDSLIASAQLVDLNNDGVEDIFQTNSGYIYCKVGSKCNPYL